MFPPMLSVESEWVFHGGTAMLERATRLCLENGRHNSIGDIAELQAILPDVANR